MSATHHPHHQWIDVQLVEHRSEKWAIDSMDDPFKRFLGFAGHGWKRTPPSRCDQAQPTHRAGGGDRLRKHVGRCMPCSAGCKGLWNDVADEVVKKGSVCLRPPIDLGFCAIAKPWPID